MDTNCQTSKKFENVENIQADFFFKCLLKIPDGVVKRNLNSINQLCIIKYNCNVFNTVIELFNLSRTECESISNRKYMRKL